MAKPHMGENSLRALTKLIKGDLKVINESLANAITTEDVNGLITTALQGAVLKTDIVDNLTSEDATKVLSAAQGKALNDKITATNTSVTALEGKVDAFDADGDGVVDTAANATKFDGHAADYFAKATDIPDVTGFISSSEKGAANGIAPLDAAGQIASQYLPSYVDDVIEGVYSEGKFYEADEAGAATTTEITGEKGKIYVDITTSTSYRWAGTVFTKIVSDDLVELTEEEVTEIWNNTTV